MATYRGEVIDGDAIVTKDGRLLHPARSQAVWNHSPDGYQWGYCGSGPAQLALAILLEETDQATAVEYYQRYKRGIVARLGHDCMWTITSAEVQAWLMDQVSRPEAQP